MELELPKVGKTTTTSMVGLVLTEGGIDPTIIVGGKLSGFSRTNTKIGNGDYIVIEANELDQTFATYTKYCSDNNT